MVINQVTFRPRKLERGGFSLLSTWGRHDVTADDRRYHFALWHWRALTWTICRPVNDPAVRQTTSQPVWWPSAVINSNHIFANWPNLKRRRSRDTAWVTEPLNDYSNEKVNGSWGRQLFQLAGGSRIQVTCSHSNNRCNYSVYWNITWFA